MTEAEKYTKAIEFQRLYAAVDSGFDPSKTEEYKIEFVARKLGIREDDGKKLADFIKDKAGDLLNENALMQAREDYLTKLKNDEADAAAKLKENIDNKVVEKAEEVTLKAKKAARVAKRKSRINIAFKIALLCLLGAVVGGGSLAIFSPLLNAVALLLGGLSGATLTGIGCGVVLCSDKIIKWWKEKGKNKYLGDQLQKEDEKAQKELSDAVAKQKSEEGVRTALKKTAIDSEQKRQDTQTEFNNNPTNQNAKNAVDNLIQNIEQKFNDCKAVNPTWASDEGDKWFRYVRTGLKDDLRSGVITDANYTTYIAKIEPCFIGTDGVFDPARVDPYTGKLSLWQYDKIVIKDTEFGKEGRGDKGPEDEGFYL